MEGELVWEGEEDKASKERSGGQKAHENNCAHVYNDSESRVNSHSAKFHDYPAQAKSVATVATINHEEHAYYYFSLHNIYYLTRLIELFGSFARL